MAAKGEASQSQNGKQVASDSDMAITTTEIVKGNHRAEQKTKYGTLRPQNKLHPSTLNSKTTVIFLHKEHRMPPSEVMTKGMSWATAKVLAGCILFTFALWSQAIDFALTVHWRTFG